MSELKMAKEAVAHAERANELLKLCIEAQGIIQEELDWCATVSAGKRMRKWLSDFRDYLVKAKAELGEEND